MSTQTTGIEIVGSMKKGYEEILTPEALDFVERLERHFGERRVELLSAREKRQTEINAGKLPDFLPETKHIRESEWTIEIGRAHV